MKIVLKQAILFVRLFHWFSIRNLRKHRWRAIAVLLGIALGAAVLIGGLVSLDGESNWLEGSMLLTIYIIIALGFFWLPM